MNKFPALYGLGGLPFWTEHDIMIREQAIQRLSYSIRKSLSGLNSAWQFERVEGPTITPKSYINPAYDGDDVFMLQAEMAAAPAAMRPETTVSSYAYAEYLLHNGTTLPLCVWQAGKSYRRETNDGASAAKMRFNEFWQLEFQCLYTVDSKADYYNNTIFCMLEEIGNITSKFARNVASDRLPSYSTSTTDIEVLLENDIWREIASISQRTDYKGLYRSKTIAVVEAAIGLDRLVLASK